MKRSKLKYIIVFIVFAILIMITGVSNAKYHFTFIEDAYQLLLDKTSPKVTVQYSETKLTNQDILVTIIANEKLKPIEGFTRSEDGMNLSKKITQNENTNVQILDLMENTLTVPIEVSWIDKEKPKISGATNGGIYSQGIDLTYTDNVGIDYVDVESQNKLEIDFLNVYYDTEQKYGIGFNDENLKIQITNSPVNIKQYEYYWDDELKYVGMEREYQYTKLTHRSTNARVYVKAIDEKGKTYTSNIIYFRPSYFKKIEVKKNANIYTVKVSGIDQTIKDVAVKTWTEFNGQDDYLEEIVSVNSDQTIQFTINKKDHGGEGGMYITHMYLNTNAKTEYVVGIQVEFGKTYTPKIATSKMFSDDGIYTITAYDKAGNSTQIKFTIDKTPPTLEISTEKVFNNQIKVKLLNVKDDNLVQNCKIYLNGKLVYEDKSNIKNNAEYIITNLTPNQTYTCYVQLTDIAGNQGKSVGKKITI